MRWRILAFLFMFQLINFMDKSIIGFAAIPIMKEFNLTYSQWGLVGSSFFWLFSVAGILGTAWSDRIGTKKVLLIMASAWTIIQFGVFGIYGFTLLVISRVILGAFEGPSYATCTVQASKWFSPGSRSFAISIISLGSTVGGLVSAPLLVTLIENYGWRLSFAFLGILSLIWALLWIWLGQEKPVGYTVSNETVSKTKKVKWSEIYPILLTPTFILTTLACFSSYWLLTWILVWMPSYFVSALHFTPVQMGLAAASIGIISSLLTVVISRFNDYLFKKNQSYRKSHVFVGGLSLIIAGLLFYSLTFVDSLAWVFIVFCLGKALTYTVNVFGPQVVNNLLPERSGTMSGIMWGLATLAGIVGPFITGFIVQFAGSNITSGFNYSVMLVAALLIVFGGLFFIFAKPDKSKPNVSTQDSNLLTEIK